MQYTTKANVCIVHVHQMNKNIFATMDNREYKNLIIELIIKFL